MARLRDLRPEPDGPTPREPTQMEWARAVREHQICCAEWDEREREDPGLQQTFHGAEAHLLLRGRQRSETP